MTQRHDGFTAPEIERYARHLTLPQVGLAGQQKLKQARVLIVGAGGLGSPVALYLASAGIGHLGLVDYDVVNLSNLQRQIIHSVASIGELKVNSAKTRIEAINPSIQVHCHSEMLSRDNVLDLFADYDIIVDATDNLPTRYLINDACLKLHKPLVYGSIFRFDGQMSVFCTAEAPCYRCLFPTPPPAHLIPSCAEGGVFGILPGTIGTLQATEVIKFILGMGQTMAGRLLLYDALAMEFNTIRIRKNPQCPVCSVPVHEIDLIDYEAFCGMPAHDHGLSIILDDQQTALQRISVTEVQQKFNRGDDGILLDVREKQEREIVSLPYDSIHLPQDQIKAAVQVIQAGNSSIQETALASIPQDAPVYVYCRSGQRSAASILLLQQVGYDPEQLYNIDGGILAWIEQIDPSLPRY